MQPGEFGNALRGPLGIHRGASQRFWFYSANYTLEAQMAYLLRLKKISASDMTRFVQGLEMPPEFAPKSEVDARIFQHSDRDRREFRILEYIGKKRRIGRDYYTRCPSCAQQGHDRSGDNLAISIGDPRKYRCWAGCTREMIRAALGRPIRRAATR